MLVGHSWGGLPVRVFAHEYAAEVAGVVLIESMHPGQAKPSAAAPFAADDRAGQQVVDIHAPGADRRAPFARRAA